MKINIYSIVKPSSDDFDKLIKDFIKMSSKYAKVEVFYIFNKEIAKAQAIGETEAKEIYTKTYLPYLKGYNIALDVLGKSVDSFAFSKLLEDKNEINFFIGGAYGFEKSFLDKCDNIISLSNLTFAHKVATLVLSEQIFRALSIQNNHPYHK
ncbi:SPOUT methyltransferase [Aliarcobacter faecis]|uniref:23S rRNA (pseudouridine(1915)-N(3))-methyltransferase RlmH n=1 Tax=Aliarcobacter faecis TaxID=1564138 RepID=UPI00047EC21D|nr:23S rRNA (pseudouridine(1915)-N(3))-methyltransferase RlmH [Aliarcobacter faecis]QKF72714.1 SPOUT methyltransferase [Aliarcobacter faecis]